MSDLPPPPQMPPPPPSGGWTPVGPYATSLMPRPPMRSLKGLSTALTVLFAILALIDIGAAMARFDRASLLDDIVDGVPFTTELGNQLLDADDGVQTFSGLHLLVALVLFVVMVIWQFRHAKNAESLGARGGLGPGWAIGGWFIPLANFVLPALQLFQSSKASDVAARVHNRATKGAGIVIAWGVAFALGAVVLGSSGALVQGDGEGNIIIESLQDVKDAASSDRSAGFGYLLFVVAAILGLLMVRSLSARQALAYAQLASTPAGPTPGGPTPADTADWAATPPSWASQGPARVYEPPPSTGAPWTDEPRPAPPGGFGGLATPAPPGPEAAPDPDATPPPPPPAADTPPPPPPAPPADDRIPPPPGAPPVPPA